MGLAHGKRKKTETRGCVGRCLQDKHREKWEEGGHVDWLQGEGEGSHDTEFK